MLNILFIVPYTPNLIRVRSYNLIRQLTARNHRVTVLSLTSSADEKADATALKELCHDVIVLPLARWRSLWNCLIALPTNDPLQSVYCWHPDLAGEISEMLGIQNGRPLFDVVHVEHLRGARYGLAANKAASENGINLPVVWDSVDSISLLFRQAADRSKNLLSRTITRLELGRTERYEARLLNQFSNVLVTSQADKDALLGLDSVGERAADVWVLSNGVDLDYFFPDPAIQREPMTIVISGKMSYHANVSMVLYLVQEIMPLVWEHNAESKLNIVGKDPPRSIRSLDQHPAITVTGTVTDIRPHIQGATIAVVPLIYGAGSQFKILEAMACGTPVIVTPRAAKPLKAVHGRDFFIAKEDAPSFAGQINNLLENPDLQQKLGTNGRAFVESNHSWGIIGTELEDIYKKAIGKTI